MCGFAHGAALYIDPFIRKREDPIKLFNTTDRYGNSVRTETGSMTLLKPAAM